MLLCGLCDGAREVALVPQQQQQRLHETEEAKASMTRENQEDKQRTQAADAIGYSLDNTIAKEYSSFLWYWD